MGRVIGDWSLWRLCSGRRSRLRIPQFCSLYHLGRIIFQVSQHIGGHLRGVSVYGMRVIFLVV